MDLDLFDDIDDAPKKVRVGTKFQPKLKPRPSKKGTPLVPKKVVTSEQAEKQSYPSDHGVSTCTTDAVVDSGPNIDVPATEKIQDSEALFERLIREDGDVMIELESLGIMNDSSPVLDNAFPSSETPAAHDVPSDPVIQSLDDSGSSLHIPNVDSVPQISVAEDLLTEDEFIVVEPVDNQQDTISMDDNIPELVGKTAEEHIQTGVSKAPRKLASRRAKKSTKEGTTTASDQSLDPHEASTPSQIGARGRVRRKRQNRDSLFHLVDEPEDDALVDARVGSDSESQPTNMSPGEPTNKSLGEKEKPSRKRKTDSKKTDKTAKKALKKFSHSTKRRIVDKSLLVNPDDIDIKKVSLTNLIRLAEHKERAAKKNEAATASQAPPPNQANGFQDYDEGGDGLGFGEDGYADEEQTIEEISGFFNYQTHMEIRRMKWTEKDTELFYECVQQFGTDFTTIQQLFPGRTRNQVRLKYKKEEKKHPLRLDEAIMNKPQGHSLSDTVIEHLMRKAAEEKKNDENDDVSLNVEEGDADESEARNEEEPASTQVDHDQDAVVDKEEVEDETIVTEHAYDSEDELVKWSQYMST